MREYRVTGEHHIVFDHLNGETFRADLEPAHEARLIAAGHIERVEDAPTSTSTDAPEPGDADGTHNDQKETA